MCTANKITHLFSHDVYNTELDELPQHHWLWNSELTDQFSSMTADLLANIILINPTSQSTHSLSPIFQSKKVASEYKAHAPMQSRHI